MSGRADDITIINKKIEELEGDLDTFLQAIREIKDIRDGVKDLPERMGSIKEDLENRKKELEYLMSSANNLLMSFEEQSRSVLFDIEKQTADLSDEVKSGISRIDNLLSNDGINLQGQFRDQLDSMSTSIMEIRSLHNESKKINDSQEQSINTLTNNYMSVSGILSRFEKALVELKRNVSVLQKRPYDLEHKIRRMEERLEALYEKYSGQKHFLLIMMIILIAAIIFSIAAYYLR